MTAIRTDVRVTMTRSGTEPTFGIDVPIAMRDQVPSRTDDQFIGTATYSNFRRFERRAQLRVDPPSPR